MKKTAKAFPNVLRAAIRGAVTILLVSLIGYTVGVYLEACIGGPVVSFEFTSFVVWYYGTFAGMLVAGALGNMYDRLFNQGNVIDFIEVNLHVWPANPWPTFNVADIFLCIGVGVLLLTLLSSQKTDLGTKPHSPAD